MSEIIDVSHPDPRTLDFLTSLEKWKLQIIENQAFAGGDIYLDGREFRNCSFEYCRIFLKVGHYKITEPYKLRNNEFIFDYPASAVRNLVLVLGQQKS